MKRVINFNAGPAAIPLEVLQAAQAEMLDWQGTGMSVMEVSHFDGRKASYLVTGNWSKFALKEAKRFGLCNSSSTENPDATFTRILRPDEIKVDPVSTYAHFTSNNTLFGSQWHYWPEVGKVPLVCDMSSDIFSRPFPADRFALIYAGAQKNLGPSGVTVVAVRDAFLDRAQKQARLPTMLSYRTHADNNSLYNTPPCFSIYVLNLTLKWLLKMGGLEAMAKINREKAAGIVGVKGHRSTGGIRFSTYNANMVDSIEDAASFMADFYKKRG